MVQAWVSLIGFSAGALTAFAFLPQVMHTWRTRSSAGLSTSMLSAQSAGVALWIVYGVAIGSRPVILANGLTLVLSITLLVFKRSFAAGSSRADKGAARAL